MAKLLLFLVLTTILLVAVDAWSGFGAPYHTRSSSRWPANGRRWLGRAIETGFGRSPFTALLRRPEVRRRPIRFNHQALINTAVRFIGQPSIDSGKLVGPAYDNYVIEETVLTDVEKNECRPKQ